MKVTAVFNSEKQKFGKYNNQIFAKYHIFQWYQNNNIPMVTEKMETQLPKVVVLYFFSTDVNNWIEIKIVVLCC